MYFNMDIYLYTFSGFFACSLMKKFYEPMFLVDCHCRRYLSKYHHYWYARLRAQCIGASECTLLHLQFLYKPVRSHSGAGWHMLYWHLQVLSSVVTRYQRFLLPTPCGEAGNILVNWGCLLPVEACLKQSPLKMFKQSWLCGWNVLQAFLPLVNRPGLCFIIF